MNRTIQNSVLGGMAGLATYFLGGWDVLIQVLITLIILDYVTGILAGYVLKELSSQIGYLGIVKKVSILILVVVAVMLDRLMESSICRVTVCSFFIGNEGISIMENCAECGIPIPAKLLVALKQIRGEGEEREAKRK